MLVLTRKPQEILVIGEDIFITTLGIKGNQVRLGIEAPNTIRVHRKEGYLKIQSDKSTQNLQQKMH